MANDTIIKKELAAQILTAARRRGADLASAVTKAVAAGFHWAVLYGDGLVADNVAWIAAARDNHHVTPSQCVVGSYSDIWA